MLIINNFVIRYIFKLTFPTMKKTLFTLLLIIGLCRILHGQEGNSIGIGVSLPDQAAMLQISAQDKGILIPRVTLMTDTDVSTISGGVVPESLLVYHIKDGVSTLENGYYYWKVDKNDTSKSKWTKILTDVDANSILEGQVTPLFVNKKEGDDETNIFVYSPNKDKPDDNTTSIDFPKLTKKYETLTTIGQAVRNIWILENGDRIALKDGEIYEGEVQVVEVLKNVPVITYINEKGEEAVIVIQDMLAAGEEAITSLVYDSVDKVLIFTDEQKKENTIDMERVVKENQTLTALSFDQGEGTLKYKDERNRETIFSIKGIVRTPWLAVDNGTIDQATKESNEFFTNANWVGIGYDKKSSNSEEALRVKGAISVTNSYYADYVFEDYFEGASSLKKDYSFKDLSTVSEYIKSNRHLPGITPICELETNEMGYSFNISELSIQLLEKTEELFLHVIELNEKLKNSNKTIKELLYRLDQQEQSIKQLQE